jgi:hypothetical protein
MQVLQSISTRLRLQFQNSVFYCGGNMQPFENPRYSDRGHSRLLAVLTLAVGLLTICAFLMAQDTAADSDAPATVTNVIAFDNMIGDPGNATAAAKAKNIIRGYLGPDSPWVINGSIKGELKTNKQLQITVRGLVLPNGTNPVPFFRGAVSCQDPTDSTKGRLFFTKTFAASSAGNSNINGTVPLPAHCIAPIVLVTSPSIPGNPAGFWFAVTGQ